MPDDARVSVNISGRAVKPAGPQEPCGTDRSVGSNFTLQSPATPAGSATPPVWVATQVSDKFVSTIPGGPEVVGVVESTLSHLSGHHPTPFDLTIRTDASLLGWGATCNGRTTGGRWSVGEAEQHINGLKLKAATLTLKSFLREGMKLPPQTLDPSPPQHILLEMDNTTAVAYVNRRGALNPLLCPYWPWNCGLSC